MSEITIETEETVIEIEDEVSLTQIEETGVEIIEIAEQGPSGPPGADGVDGTDGLSSDDAEIMSWLGL